MAAILMGWLGAAGAAGAVPALWLVRDADSEIYLFGTLHALPPGLDWRTPAYDAAYRKADAVWLEAEVDRASPAEISDLVTRYGVDFDRRLSQRLSSRDLARLSRQVDVARIDHLRPWAAALMLSMQPGSGPSVSVDAGADMAISRRARRNAKPIRTFETLEEQARMFASLPEPSELKYLTGVIRERAQPRRIVLGAKTPNLQDAWMQGDLARLAPELVDEMRHANPGLYEAFLKNRNLAWAATLEERLSGSGVDLVNVGALHMIGPDGLPALLAARGYRVDRIQ